jgi:prepilin-type N-terminal cleavage/methylation domain-containing protein
VPDDEVKHHPGGAVEGGFTLVEMVIVMSLLTVVFSLCMYSLISIQHSVSTTDARTQAQDQARLAVQEIDRQVRSGNIFYTPFNGGMSMIVFTQANGANRCVEWQVASSGQLQTRSWTQTWQTDGSPAIVPWSTIATGITNTASNPPFVLDSGSSYGDRILDIDIVTNAKGSLSSGSEISDSVEGRNTVYGYSATACSLPFPASS